MSKPKRKAPPGSNITRERILGCAISEFAARGYDGCRVDTIAEKSAISKNMLYYYFGNKEALYIAVLERSYEKVRDTQENFEIDQTDPISSLREIISHTFQAMNEYPEFIRLMNDENLRNAIFYEKSNIKNLFNPLLDTIERVIEDGVNAGVFRTDLDPKILYLILSSLCYHYISNQHTLEMALDMDLGSQEARDVWLANITSAVTLYCLLDGERDGYSPIKVARALPVNARRRDS